MTSPKPLLQIIICSTRPGRVGAPIATWFFEHAKARDEFDVELIDLAEVNLPLLDEPHHPRLRDYVHEHTRQWSAIVARADAFVFVIPEYNYSINGATKNAIDFLHYEWRRKPFGLVCYGGVSRGLRSAQVLKASLTSLEMPWTADVPIWLAATPVVDGEFRGDDMLAQSAALLLDQLALYAPICRQLRD